MTTAASTDFVSTRLDGPGWYYLYLDGNQKISGWRPTPNAFSLVQVKDCPGSTPVCRASCYVHHLEEHQPQIHDLYRHNSQTIRSILLDPATASGWARCLGEWITENAPREIGFRWHVSGDVFSPEYAAWLVLVCEHSPDVRHWIYTRTLEAVPDLITAENLTVNVSADDDNYVLASLVARRYNLRICYMGTRYCVPVTLRKGDVLFSDYAYRRDLDWLVRQPKSNQRAICPVDFLGKSEEHRCGPCQKCIRPRS